MGGMHSKAKEAPIVIRPRVSPRQGLIGPIRRAGKRGLVLVSREADWAIRVRAFLQSVPFVRSLMSRTMSGGSCRDRQSGRGINSRRPEGNAMGVSSASSFLSSSSQPGI